MCMSILSEHWAPRCRGTCCLSILAKVATTLKWLRALTLKILAPPLRIQIEVCVNIWAATWFGLFVLGSTLYSYHHGLWSAKVVIKKCILYLGQQWDSPFGLPHVTSVSPAGFVPAKRALLSLNLAAIFFFVGAARLQETTQLNC